MIKKFYLTPKWDPNMLGQNEARSNCNEGILYISQTSRIGVSSVSATYRTLVVGGGHPSAEMQSAYSTARADLLDKSG